MTTATSSPASALDAHLDAGARELLADTERRASEVFAPLARRGRDGEVDRALLAALAEQGLLARLLSRDAGGWRSEISALALCLIREGLARWCTAAETAFAMQGLGSFPLLQSGTREAIEEWIPRVASGEAAAGFALSEPQAGSDVAGLALSARRDDDAGGWRLNGQKTWISNAPDADVYSVFARTTPGAGARGLTAFLVPGGAEGLIGHRIELVSPHPIGTLVFEDVRVPPEYVLGEVDHGFAVAMRTLDMFRPSVGAFAVGMARAAIDATIAYTSEREAFGGPLARMQAVRHRLADVATRVQAARLLVHAAASAYDAGVSPTTEAAAMAKLMATEVAQEAVDAAIQLHGATALRRGHLLEHLYREVRAPRIYEGASEIQREIIARAMFARTEGR
ncbi:MAG: acyl-CoA dehydrogenase family protein [Solirubrobacterales bacterium]|nr:acyl-CoA dehydrogenase family protein [Solirubrobacterales bacterium]